jgi:hypothetical protein
VELYAYARTGQVNATREQQLSSHHDAARDAASRDAVWERTLLGRGRHGAQIALMEDRVHALRSDS